MPNILRDAVSPGLEQADRDYAVTHPLRPMLTAGILSLGLFVLSSVLSYATIRASPPPLTMPLLIYTAAFVLLWVAGLVVMVARRAGHAERVRVWSRLAIFIILGSHLACFGLIWGVMPFLRLDGQLLLAIPLIGCVPVQLICSPENSLANRSGAVGVIGSLGAFFATRGTEFTTFAALYIFGFAIIMLILGDRVAGTVRATVAARLASDAAARKLDRLLSEVAAERDAKTKFIAAASHDLGQPLAAAALFFDQSLRTTDDLARAKAIEGVRRAFASADQLLSHMLGHLRLEADAVEPHRSQVAVGPLLARVAAQYAPAAAAAGIALRTTGARLSLLLDPPLIERALGNLIDNAIQHSRGRRILLGARRQGDIVRLWVIDDGVGVAPIDARHIFDDYYQADTGGAAQRNGFGLGLSSARRLAIVMAGSAGLDARWRRGAAFYLEFGAASVASSARRHGELAA
ncbi:HAMP domain-containing histidine kinase [Polymorphobacter sp. PAMC 29334]|uniref:sensor histidine kinase n=1 Tax=Polymorphobacter sp. PAMC 29334 TaxID=2862331 RepID=UPI001C76DCA2|nr:HAMP domain-containing sensor histidine kinase [Polymorphobacter sp. PAMC 29334]QYE36579.1 HAMP domain-containing histidine kinase [Polymorphobacter sp. PAMC 29334]